MLHSKIYYLQSLCRSNKLLNVFTLKGKPVRKVIKTSGKTSGFFSCLGKNRPEVNHSLTELNYLFINHKIKSNYKVIKSVSQFIHPSTRCSDSYRNEKNMYMAVKEQRKGTVVLILKAWTYPGSGRNCIGCGVMFMFVKADESQICCGVAH